MFIRDPIHLEKKEQQALAAICQASPTAQAVYGLAQDFMQMLGERSGERLDGWLGQLRASHIPELQRFVRSIERDKVAVLAGLTLPYSNGVVEGKVNKLKLIKRMMFGRAEFPRLAPACPSRFVVQFCQQERRETPARRRVCGPVIE